MSGSKRGKRMKCCFNKKPHQNSKHVRLRKLAMFEFNRLNRG